jgi:hypothetical protein
MTRWRGTVLSTTMASVVAVGALTTTASAQPDETNDRDDQAFTFAVIGDIPYGDAQIARFPKVVDQINADPAVQLVDHLGDIKSGSSQCTDEYFSMIRTQFDRFVDPLIYTPGDNEWTDCHRPNNGSYNPLERLAAVRKVFFPRPDKTLGQHSVKVRSQADQGFVENVSYSRADVGFAAVHVVGSNNSLVPWTGHTAPTTEQLDEVHQRTAAALSLIDNTFDKATKEHQRAVVLLMQADMFDPTVPNPQLADYSGFQPIVQKIAERSAKFTKPVYLFNGDSHIFHRDQPLKADSTWLTFYGVPTPAPNLTRITVDGSTGVNDYLRVSVDSSDPQVLSVVNVPFAP